MKKDSKSLLWGALFGSVVGSVTALLFAPKPGKELRNDIVEGTTASIEKVQEIAVQAGDKTVELYDNAKDKIELVVHEIREWSKSCVPVIDEEEQLVVSEIPSEEISSEEEITVEVVRDDKDNEEIV